MISAHKISEPHTKTNAEAFIRCVIAGNTANIQYPADIIQMHINSLDASRHHKANSNGFMEQIASRFTNNLNFTKRSSWEYFCP